MSIAISDDHRALSETASDFLTKRGVRGVARSLLEAETEAAAFWGDLVKLGWLGLHLPEEHGGSGYGLEGSWSSSRSSAGRWPPGRSCPR